MQIFDRLRTVLTRDNITRCVLYGFLPALVFYLVALFIMRKAGFSFVEILRDPAQQTEQSSFLGFLSSVGTWFWVSAAAISFFRVLSDAPAEAAHRTVLWMIAGFSLFLGVDDFFLIHDRYITEGILIPIYIVFLWVLLKRYNSVVMGTDGTAFLMAGGLLAFSVVVDAVQEILPIGYGASQVLEEGGKFTGAAVWMFFCARVAAYRGAPLQSEAR